MDGLLNAFRALANGKDHLQPADLTASGGLKQPDADFLLARLSKAPVEGDGGTDALDYVPFCKEVYGEAKVVGDLKKQKTYSDLL